MRLFTTTYCNQAHDLDTGNPVNHECYVLPVKVLELERDGKHSEATAILSCIKRPKIHKGV